MKTKEYITGKIKKMIPASRLAHTMAAADTSVLLADKYGVDSEKARIAALVHDCAKGMSIKALCRYALKNKIFHVFPNGMRHLLHGYVAAHMAGRLFQIRDRQILNAVKYHSTGRPGMSALEKVIFIADYIEPGRKFKGRKKLYKTAIKGRHKIDMLMFIILQSKLSYLVSRGCVIHENSWKLWNRIISQNSFKLMDKNIDKSL